MVNLYVTSAETFSGKSALCIGLGVRFRDDGLKAGYMKPVNVNCQQQNDQHCDEDVVFARQIFDMQEPPERLGPVVFDPAGLERQLRGPEVNFASQFAEAFKEVSANHDVMVLEGGRSWREGYVAGLSAKRVVELTQARVVIVLKYEGMLLVDRALAAQDYFGEALVGVVVNETPRNNIENVHSVMEPYLMRHHLDVLGVLPKDPRLAAPTVAELVEGLHAKVLCGEEKTGELVETMLVGAMSVESALSYFRRKVNKAVITGGDRSDIQLAALETSTKCLILTGNLNPSPFVLNRADELGVPVLLVNMDTLGATEVVESYLGRSRFQQPEKVQRFTALLSENLNFPVLYDRLGIRLKK
jgi:BioD-like phosphotransacetylase family protein